MTTGEPQKRFITAAEVCEELGIHRKTLQRWIEAGRFPQPLRLHRRAVWLKATYESAVQQAAETDSKTG